MSLWVTARATQRVRSSSRGLTREIFERFCPAKTPELKWLSFRADVLHVMEQGEPKISSPDHTQSETLPIEDQRAMPDDLFAVSAHDLLGMIRNGQGNDVNELVNRTLSDRRAA